MSKPKITCPQCKKKTTAAPCQSNYGYVEGEEYYISDCSGTMCPVCAAIWLINNCMSLQERKALWEKLQ